MKRIWKGKPVLRLKRECPYYGTGCRHLEKVYFFAFGWSLSLWTYHEDNALGELSDWAKRRLLMGIFPNGKLIDGRTVLYRGNTYHVESLKWLFNTKYDFLATHNPQVFLDCKTETYYGYSHRAVQGFKVGDALFEENYVNENLFCENRKYRWRLLKALIKYHFKNDSCGFQFLLEEGIRAIVPFRERGSKKIETPGEAFQAAENFAKYVS